MKTIILLIVTSFLLISSTTYAQGGLIEWAPTGLFENGKEISLEVVIFKPKGEGPFPTVMFNHGSTGFGDNPAKFKITYTAKEFAKFFTERGWLVAFPQRRGRGQSGGIYDEGFEPDRSHYTCSTKLSLAGLERALQDLDTVVRYLKSRSYVDSKKMLIGGQSRGGILSIVYAGTRTHPFKGVINFVGGWISEGRFSAKDINTASFRRGAGFKHQTLWLYGKNDRYYSIQHSRENFDAFVAAGGKGNFIAYTVPSESYSKNGHSVLYHPSLWKKAITQFIENIK